MTFAVELLRLTQTKRQYADLLGNIQFRNSDSVTWCDYKL